MNVASFWEICATISSVTFLDSANISFVSFKTDSGVAVKLGGACGGLRNFSELMAEVVTGRNGFVDEVAGMKGRS